MAAFRIAVIGGDGIGPEVIDQAIRVADAAVRKHDGADARVEPPAVEQRPTTSRHGRILPADGWDTLRQHDAILFGADRPPGRARHGHGPRACCCRCGGGSTST